MTKNQDERFTKFFWCPQLYQFEGIQFDHISYVDNQPVLDLIEGKKTGILKVLDEQCRMPKTTDMTFLEALTNKQRSNPDYYQKHVKMEKCFIVNHYAGRVVYDATGWLEKNNDTLQVDLIKLLAKSNWDFIDLLFPDAKDQKKAKKVSLGAQFSKQLNTLMKTLNATEPHYIRCIKPNPHKSASEWVGKMVLEQVLLSVSELPINELSSFDW